MPIPLKLSQMHCDRVRHGNRDVARPLLSLLEDVKSFITTIRPLMRLLHNGVVPGYSHSMVLPYTTYSPWFDDEDFLGAFNDVADYTLCDLYRCYQLWSLLSQVVHVPGAVMEVGVWRGGSGCLIAKRCAIIGISSDVYLCDTFKGVVKAGEHDPVFTEGALQADRHIVEKLAESLRLDNVYILEGVFPEETSCFVKDQALRFLHVDVDVYESAKDILSWAWPRMSRGGVVVFDDYGNAGLEGVIKLVQESSYKSGAFFAYNLSGQAMLIKLYG